MDQEILKEANKLMDGLAKANKGTMGLSSREEGIFDTLLWLIGGGDAPEELEDID